jgi:hypothetical protein
MNGGIIHWNQIYLNGYVINDDTIFNTYADDQVLLSDSKDDLLRILYTMHNTKIQFGMKIPPLKT